MPTAKPIAGRGVHLELQKMTYTSATQEVEGGESAQQSIKYDTVATADVTSGDKAGHRVAHAARRRALPRPRLLRLRSG